VAICRIKEPTTALARGTLEPSLLHQRVSFGADRQHMKKLGDGQDGDTMLCNAETLNARPQPEWLGSWRP